MPIRLKGGRHKYQILIIMGSSKPRSKADVRQDMRRVEEEMKSRKKRLEDNIKCLGPHSAQANSERNAIKSCEERLRKLEDEMDRL